LTTAQQQTGSNESGDVFDDVLDSLVPGAQPQEAIPNDIDPTGDQLPDAAADDPLPEIQSDAWSAESDAQLPNDASRGNGPDTETPIPSEPSGNTGEVDDVFGTESAPRSPSDLPGDLPNPTQMPTEPPQEPLPLVPESEPESTEPDASELDRHIPEGASEQAAPLRPPGDEVVDYNGRDCPAELADLQDAWERLRSTPIESISLDITPSIEPQDPTEEAPPTPRDTLGDAPSRTWHGRQGEVLFADGKLENFRNGKILVRKPDGQTQWLSWYELSNDDLCFVTAWWGIPTEFSPEVRPYEIRNWTMITFTWTASALCHKPLYFEDVQLERYGHMAGPMKQAALSGVHFFGNIFFLPYHMGLNPPNECQYALGYYRPGNCAPWMIPATPLSARAFRWQMSALVSGLTLLP
jgi:hypothetical protein